MTEADNPSGPAGPSPAPAPSGPDSSAPPPSAVDHFLAARLLPAEPGLDDLLRASRAAGLPAADVSPLQGRLLELLARMLRAERILEIGTLGGYSTLWLARSGARVVTLEVDPQHAAVARENLDRAGAGDAVEIVVGPALETLPGVEGPFDLVFIDADKQRSADYLALALEKARPGALIVVDNVVRGGALADPADDDPRVVGSRRVVEAIGADPRLVATGLQTVGVKGWDGLVLALVA